MAKSNLMSRDRVRLLQSRGDDRRAYQYIVDRLECHALVNPDARSYTTEPVEYKTALRLMQMFSDAGFWTGNEDAPCSCRQRICHEGCQQITHTLIVISW